MRWCATCGHSIALPSTQPHDVNKQKLANVWTLMRALVAVEAAVVDKIRNFLGSAGRASQFLGS